MPDPTDEQVAKRQHYVRSAIITVILLVAVVWIVGWDTLMNL